MTIKHSLKGSIIGLMILSPSLCFANTDDLLMTVIHNLVQQQVANNMDKFISLDDSFNPSQAKCFSNVSINETQHVMESAFPQIKQFVKKNPEDAKLIEETLSNPDYTNTLLSAYDYSDVANQLINTIDLSAFLSGDANLTKNAQEEFELKAEEFAKNKLKPLEEATNNLSPEQQQAMDKFLSLYLQFIKDFELSDKEALAECLSLETDQSNSLPAD